MYRRCELEEVWTGSHALVAAGYSHNDRSTYRSARTDSDDDAMLNRRRSKVCKMHAEALSIAIIVFWIIAMVSTSTHVRH